ncbi:MAG: glycosyltransferase family A protein [Lutibacter sp.]|nr:glycosyltransferase family A protein [Lutibacter sp.]
MNKPLVSIIVPCYNQAQYLEEALQSVLDQTYTNWECIVVNDGSPDNTQEVAQKWVEKDKRFKYLFQDNSGVSSARNFGIANAIGEFILPLDADDKISPNYVLLAVESFQQDTSLKVVYCKAEKFGDEVGLWDLKHYSIRELALSNMIFCSGMYRKSDWETVGGYDIKMIYGWEDWEFWISLLKNGGNVKQIDKIGFYYRVRKNSRERNILSYQMKSLLEYLSVKHADFFVKQLGSFTSLNHTIINTKREHEMKLKSEKFVIDVFCKRFFGFTVFGKYK